jgi:uncharacterized membrane protein
VVVDLCRRELFLRIHHQLKAVDDFIPDEDKRGTTATLFATSVPASAAVPTAAADQQDNHDDDEKCRGVHNAPRNDRDPAGPPRRPTCIR